MIQTERPLQYTVNHSFGVPSSFFVASSFVIYQFLSIRDRCSAVAPSGAVPCSNLTTNANGTENIVDKIETLDWMARHPLLAAVNIMINTSAGSPRTINIGIMFLQNQKHHIR